MMTYETYQSMGGTLNPEAFAVHEREAEAYLNLMTHNRVKGESPVRENVVNAVFDLIAIFAREAEAAASDIGIISATNDGVNVTYMTPSALKAYWQQLKRELLTEYLAYETVTIDGNIIPLLYAGIEFDVYSGGQKEV